MDLWLLYLPGKARKGRSPHFELYIILVAANFVYSTYIPVVFYRGGGGEGGGEGLWHG